jgi:hypothetical protein
MNASYPFPCFSTKNSVDRNTEVPCSQSSIPPIRFVSLRHLRRYWIVEVSYFFHGVSVNAKLKHESP